MRLILTTLPVALAMQGLAGNYQPNGGTNDVGIVRSTWHDAQRNRDVPVKLFIPQAPNGPCPVILFSPGLGGSRENYAYLGEGWATSGFVCVFLQHPGSDPAIFKDDNIRHRIAAMRKVLKQPQHILDRVQDFKFAIDEMTRLDRTDSSLSNRLDLSRVGIAGHSYGAGAAMISVGERVPEVGEQYRDDRITAAIAISPPIFHGLEFDDVRLPVLVVTGTRDAGFTRTWIFRHTIYDKIKSPGTCLVVFKGAEHFTFGDPQKPRDQAKAEKFHPLILAATTAFWDAHLRNNADARAWLEGGGLKQLMQDAGKFRVKQATAQPASD